MTWTSGYSLIGIATSFLLLATAHADAGPSYKLWAEESGHSSSFKRGKCIAKHWI